MEILYYVSVTCIILAAIIVLLAGSTAIVHILRNPNARAVQDLQGPLREYELAPEELNAAKATV